MAVVPLTPETASRPRSPGPRAAGVREAEPRHPWLLSLAFWICLLFSASLYALVALSPKLLTWGHLSRQYHENQLRLVAVEQQIQHLQKVIDGLQHDPTFARELARMDFDAVSPDEQRIPVESSLSLKIRPSGPDLDVAPPDLPWYTPIVETVARNRGVENTLLLVAATVIVYAFACLHPFDRRPQSAR